MAEVRIFTEMLHCSHPLRFGALELDERLALMLKEHVDFLKIASTGIGSLA